MFLDQNEVSLFQKSTWNALCKNGILLNIPLFSKPNFKAIFFNKTTQDRHFCTFKNLIKLQKSLGYAIKNFEDFSEFKKKSSFSRKLKNTKFEP